jgi:hypothetical protein
LKEKIMSKIKNSLVAFSFFLALFAFAPVASYGQTARPPADVNVVNTPNVKVANTSADPVPTLAQGTTTVAGTVQAQQSGSWDVGITGTPTFQVGNVANNPVLGRDVDNPARQPFTNVVSDNHSFTVPPGKRLVIEYVSGGGFISTGQKFLEVGFLFTALIDGDRAGVQHHFVPVFTGTQNTGTNLFDIYAVSQQTRIYVEPGGLVEGFLEKTSGVAGVSFTVSGYLVDVP